MTIAETHALLEEEILQLKNRLQKFEQAYRHRTKMWEGARSAAAIWEGKFHAVKRENNALRRTLYHRQKEGGSE